MLRIFFKTKPTKTTKFSAFIREASSRDRKRVYTDVLKRASARQVEVLERATKGKRTA
jgi:hypothetical protein